MRKIYVALATVFLGLLANGQSLQDSTLAEVTLQQAVEYSIKHQPVIQQALADEQITEANIRIRLSDWYPQLNFGYNYQHNFVLPTSIFNGTPAKIGQENTSAAQFNISQAIFNRDVLLASRTKRDVRLAARQNTSSNKIEIAANVSKAFYDVLATIQQVKVATTNIIRIERSLKDTYNQYQAGITDKTDYKRAMIALNNAKAAKKSNEEILKAKTEYLKYLMGYPDKASLNIVYDSLQMEKEALVDTLQDVNYTNRIEYKQLETQQSLLEANVKYAKWSFLPSLTASGAYNFNYQNNEFTKLYNTNYPNSFGLLTLGFPIFQGGRRKAEIQEAQWQSRRNKLEITNLRNSINSEYANALASYKSNWANYTALKENLDLAREVYDVIQLQYRSGIKTYLEVINSETDLRTAQINYYNSLYNLLASKIDLQRALGQINY